jgi:hypothetical protein
MRRKPQIIKLKGVTVRVSFPDPVKEEDDQVTVRVKHTTTDGKSLEFSIYESEIAMLIRILEGWR